MMTVDELARRVYQRRHAMMVADGSVREFEVVLSPEDWIDVVTELRPVADQKVTYDAETGEHRIIGVLMRMERDLPRGEVKLRMTVAA